MDSMSSYWGVVHRNETDVVNRWRARFTHSGIVLDGGSYFTEEEAAHAVNEMIVMHEVKGTFAKGTYPLHQVPAISSEKAADIHYYVNKLVNTGTSENSWRGISENTRDNMNGTTTKRFRVSFKHDYKEYIAGTHGTRPQGAYAYNLAVDKAELQKIKPYNENTNLTSEEVELVEKVFNKAWHVNDVSYRRKRKHQQDDDEDEDPIVAEAGAKKNSKKRK